MGLGVVCGEGGVVGWWGWVWGFWGEGGDCGWGSGSPHTLPSAAMKAAAQTE